MLKPQNARKFLLAIVLSAAAAVSGCGTKQTAPLSEGAENSQALAGAKLAEPPLEQQTEQKLDPLTKDDVDLYLKAMRAAAERAKNLKPEDRATLENAKKILAASASGHIPTPDDAKTIERANLVAISMDQIVSEEMKLDGRTYRGIAEAVESVIPNPALTQKSGKSSPPAPDHALTPLEQRLRDINAANEKFLAPYRDEIQRLIAVVRNPGNLPK